MIPSPGDLVKVKGYRTDSLGLILEIKDDLFGVNYRVHLSNGITRWIGDDVIRDLFEPVQSDVDV